MSRAAKPGSRPAANRRARAAKRESTTEPVTAGRGRVANARRTRTATETDSGTAAFIYRYRVGGAVMLLALILAAAQLFSLQVPQAAGLRAQAAGQLKVTDV